MSNNNAIVILFEKWHSSELTITIEITYFADVKSQIREGE